VFLSAALGLRRILSFKRIPLQEANESVLYWRAVKMNPIKMVSLSFLICLLTACPNQEGEPLEEPSDLTFQEVGTPANSDAGNTDEAATSAAEDAGEGDGPTAPETRDAGSANDVRPPARDGGMTNQRCDVSDLIYTAEPRDANGPCSNECDSETIEFVGKVFNPCDHAIEFTTNSSCIVSQWEWKKHDQANAQSERMSPMCGQAITTHRLAADSSKEQSSRQITGFRVGNWVLTITFSSFSSGNAISVSPAGEEVSVTFSSL
jgi:hypothetical protein